MLKTKNILKITLYILYITMLISLPTRGSKNVCFATNILKVKVPKKVVLGNPFKVWIYYKGKTPIKILWLDKTITLHSKYLLHSHNLNLILGSDVKKDSSGYKKLVIKSNGFNIAKRILIQKRKSSITRITVSKKYVSMKKPQLKRYFREREIVKSILSRFTEKKYYTPNFISPITPSIITSPYARVRIINNTTRSIHTGVDFKAPAGTVVRAINSGKIVFIGDHLFSGKSIYIDHGMGIISMYFHLSKFLVHAGEIVKKGQPIALSGCTGRTSGPHLHLGVSVLGKLIDPMELIKRF